MTVIGKYDYMYITLGRVAHIKNTSNHPISTVNSTIRIECSEKFCVFLLLLLLFLIKLLGKSSMCIERLTLIIFCVLRLSIFLFCV